MNIELEDEFIYQIKDAFMIEFLKDDLNTILKAQSCEAWMHEDDVKDNKKLIKAYKTILKYYGVHND
jgi:hypothetical protein